MKQFGHNTDHERFENEDAAAHDPNRHLDCRPHEREAGVVREVGRSGRRGDGCRGADEEFLLESLLEEDDPDDVYHGDEPAHNECGDENDLLSEFHAERCEEGQGKEEDGEVGEHVDGCRREVERDDINARPVHVAERGDHRATLEDVEKGEDGAGDDDDGHGEDRGVPEEHVSSGHAVVQYQDRRFGRHDRGIVQDGECVDTLLQRGDPLALDFCGISGHSVSSDQGHAQARVMGFRG
jgi:hypothetical protein